MHTCLLLKAFKVATDFQLFPRDNFASIQLIINVVRNENNYWAGASSYRSYVPVVVEMGRNLKNSIRFSHFFDHEWECHFSSFWDPKILTTFNFKASSPTISRIFEANFIVVIFYGWNIKYNTEQTDLVFIRRLQQKANQKLNIKHIYQYYVEKYKNWFVHEEWKVANH